MSSRYKVQDDQCPHFLTFTVTGWVDVFTRSQYADALLESLQYCIDNKGLRMHAWVIMSNHVHLIASVEEGFSIPGFVRDFKKFTSHKVTSLIEANKRESRKGWMLQLFSFAGKRSGTKEYQFWQADYHPVRLDNAEMLEQRLNYLHLNPVRAGYVDQPEWYRYSSAVWHVKGESGLLMIQPVEIS